MLQLRRGLIPALLGGKQEDHLPAAGPLHHRRIRPAHVTEYGGTGAGDAGPLRTRETN